MPTSVAAHLPSQPCEGDRTLPDKRTFVLRSSGLNKIGLDQSHLRNLGSLVRCHTEPTKRMNQHGGADLTRNDKPSPVRAWSTYRRHEHVACKTDKKVMSHTMEFAMRMHFGISCLHFVNFADALTSRRVGWQGAVCVGDVLQLVNRRRARIEGKRRHL